MISSLFSESYISIISERNSLASDHLFKTVKTLMKQAESLKK
jgi:hypothetical protein